VVKIRNQAILSYKIPFHKKKMIDPKRILHVAILSFHKKIRTEGDAHLFPTITFLQDVRKQSHFLLNSTNQQCREII
jgi:hypothetical protein